MTGNNINERHHPKDWQLLHDGHHPNNWHLLTLSSTNPINENNHINILANFSQKILAIFLEYNMNKIVTSIPLFVCNICNN
eukprot:UN01379